jgi:hypothetical protein
MFKKKVVINKPIKFKNIFHEIWIDIDDLESKSYERFRLESIHDQIFIHEGNIYVIDKKCVEKLTKYDMMLDVLGGYKKLVRLLSFKKLGFIEFKSESNVDNIILPVDRTNALEMIQPVKPTPPLLKVITESSKYAKFIRSLNMKKLGMELKGKWIYIVVIIIIAIIIGLFITGVITPEMLGVNTHGD